jgi:hypothetical protein
MTVIRAVVPMAMLYYNHPAMVTMRMTANAYVNLRLCGTK